ncbi:hypothetical protein [Polyangium spumosum]|uniref:Uncharacterized protein n=1 Tax=Polyangium spumosum TaxID=889282 RepID=A0A6N7Q0W5_9BACT|nr:hypothetical protein [Polyangium spumosum]MRG96836.1 hypothetical protein [Polyangium spumosum]
MPSASGTKKFLDLGPLAFAQTHSVVPDGGPTLSQDTVATHYPGESRHEIKPAHRVRRARLDKNHLATSDRHLAYVLTQQPHAPGTPAGADEFLTWYLPWNAGGGQVSMPIPSADALGPDAANPPYFFTVELTGCSVFIRGEPESPEVFHAGSTTTTWKGSGSTHWRTLFAMSRPDTFASGRFVEVNKFDYIGGERLGVPFASPVVQRYIRHVTEHEGGRDPSFKLIDCGGIGCVFGSRDGAGAWSFYLQENARVFFRRATTAGPYVVANRVLRVSQIYPHRAVLTTNDPPKALPFP